MKIIISTLFVFLGISCFAQFSMDWEQWYHAEKEATFNDVLQTRNGETVAVGTFRNLDLIITTKNVFFLKIKDTNAEDDQRIIPIKGLEEGVNYGATAVAETCDDKFVVIGYKQSKYRKKEGWAMVLNKEGDIIGKNIFQDYDFGKGSVIHDVIVTYENHIVMVGENGNQPWIWKFDGLRKEAAILSEGGWKGSKGMNVVKKIVATRDGNYAIVGDGKNKAIFQKIAIDAHAETKIEQLALLTYPNFWEVSDMIQTMNGGFAMIGYRRAHREQIALGIVSQNSSGRLVRKSTKAIVARSHNRGTGIVERNDRKLIVTGFGTSYDTAQIIPRGFVTIFDEKGNHLEKDLTKWQWFGGKGIDKIEKIAKIGEQRLVAVGNTQSKGKNKQKGLWSFQLNLDTLRLRKPILNWSFPIEKKVKTFRENYPLQFSFSSKPIALFCYRNGKVIPWTAFSKMVHDTIRNQYVYTQSVPLAIGENEIKIVGAFEQGGKKTGGTIVASNKKRIYRSEETEDEFYPKEQRIALLIGNGDYLGEQGNACVEDLSNPFYDVDSLENVLKLLDFEVWKYKDLQKSEMEKILKDFHDTLSNYNIRLFYYAGHGFQKNNINYLQPLDGCLTNVEDNIPLEKIIHTMKVEPDSSSDFVINNIVLDACRINTNAPRARFGEQIVKIDPENQGFSAIPSIDDFYITYATAPNQPAYDGLETVAYNSPFAKAFVKCLKYSDLGVNDVFEATKAEIENIFKSRNKRYKTQLPLQRPKMESGLKARKGKEFLFNF